MIYTVLDQKLIVTKDGQNLTIKCDCTESRCMHIMLLLTGSVCPARITSVPIFVEHTDVGHALTVLHDLVKQRNIIELELDELLENGGNTDELQLQYAACVARVDSATHAFIDAIND